jgi:class 3 adenylate cyclase/tetratricopeptide (TPR) repeat protein
MNVKSSETPLPPKGERHRLTVLFSDLVGSTVLGREMESEHFSELLSQLRDIWHQAALKHGGRVIRTQGDGALAVFGYPHSGEDDGRRAAEAALDIHQWVGQVQHDGVPPARLPLRMHSGIHAGTLLLAEGDIEWGRFDLIGDVVNTAAHLSRHAAAGQILVTLDALGPNANFFQLDETPREAAPDFGRLQVCAVLGRSSATRRFEATARRGLTPFIGRGEAETFLTDFLGAASPAAQRCVLVVGGPGLGKTRLLEEVLHRHENGALMVLRGSCESYLGAEVLQPFLQILRAFFEIQADMPEAEAASTARTALQPWIAELGPRTKSILALVSGGTEAGASRLTASGVVGDLLVFFAALSARNELVLVIDDWQWADDASRQLMEALLQLNMGPRVILASRPRDDGAEWISGAPHLSIEPFQGAETDRAVRRWVPHADPFLVARIHSYAGGVPLFIEELCHSVAAGNPSYSLEGRGTQGWVATLVASRLARLPPEQVHVVRAAAVIGNAVPNWLLASACDGAPDLATMRALADADFLYAAPAAGGVRFKHGITRDAVYEAIGLRERQALHERVELALLARSEQTDREDTLEALAHHSRGAGHWENAAHYAERAGDKAMAAFALDRARAQYQVAMETLDRVQHRSREQSLRWCLLANKLGMVSIFDPLSLSDDVTIFERAVALARSLGDASAITRGHYWLGYMCYGFGRFREGENHARQALTLARESGDLPLAAQIEASLGQILAATCQYDQAITLLDNAVSAKQQRSRPGGGIAIGSAYALSCKASVLADRGEFDQADVCLAEAMALVGESTHPVANSVRNWVAVSLAWQGRWEEAERVAVESARIAENTQALLLLVVCRAASGFARWSRGNAAGLQQLRDAVQWIEARGGRFYTSLYYGWLVEACAAEGDIVSARRFAARALRRAREGERLGEAMACRGMARIAAARGDFAASERWLRRAEHSAKLRGSPREAALNQAVRAEILARQGQAEAACRSSTEAVAALRAMGMHWHASRATTGLEAGASLTGS